MSDRQRAKEFWTDAEALSELAERTGEQGNQLAAVVFTAARFAALGIHPDPVMPPSLPRAGATRPRRVTRPRQAMPAMAPEPVAQAVTAEADIAVPTAPVERPVAEPPTEPQLEVTPTTMPIIEAPTDEPIIHEAPKTVEPEEESLTDWEQDLPTDDASPSPGEEAPIRVSAKDVEAVAEDEPVGATAVNDTSSPYRRRAGRLVLLALICVVAWMAHTGRLAPIEQVLMGPVKQEMLLAPGPMSADLPPSTMKSTDPAAEKDGSVFKMDQTNSTMPETENESSGEWMKDKLFAGEESNQAPTRTEEAKDGAHEKRTTAHDEILEAVRTAKDKPNIQIKPKRPPIAGPAIIEAIRTATQEPTDAEGDREASEAKPATPDKSDASSSVGPDEAEAIPMYAEGMAEWVGSLHEAVWDESAEPEMYDTDWMMVTDTADVPMIRELVEQSVQRESAPMMVTAPSDPMP